MSLVGDVDSLVNLSGLNALTTIGGDFIVVSNPALLNIQGLNSLTRVDGVIPLQKGTMPVNPMTDIDYKVKLLNWIIENMTGDTRQVKEN